jgi:uncharacterized membrane protein
MGTGRLEAFSDAVIAIVMTIMVLELHVPAGADVSALAGLGATLVSYVLSFVFLGIYWSNHHHLLQAAQGVSGKVLWANLHLLFWLTLVPFTTAWMGQTSFQTWPVAVYGAVLLMAAVAYYLLTRALLAHHSQASTLSQAVGDDRKGRLSLALYAAAVPLAFVNRWLAVGIYIFVALIWLVPDPRIERRLTRPEP